MKICQVQPDCEVSGYPNVASKKKYIDENMPLCPGRNYEAKRKIHPSVKGKTDSEQHNTVDWYRGRRLPKSSLEDLQFLSFTFCQTNLQLSDFLIEFDHLTFITNVSRMQCSHRQGYRLVLSIDVLIRGSSQVK